MPAYSFKGQFVPYVEEGSKPHTIRARRKNFAKKGDMLYLYFGMRTKFCRKIREESCTDVRTIFIGYLFKKVAIGICNKRLDDFELEELKAGKIDLNEIGFKILSDVETNRLAWRDGFRPEGSSYYNTAGCFDLMMRFWNTTHELPFYGDIIYWDPYKTKAKDYDFNSRNNLETSIY